MQAVSRAAILIISPGHCGEPHSPTCINGRPVLEKLLHIFHIFSNIFSNIFPIFFKCWHRCFKISPGHCGEPHSPTCINGPRKTSAGLPLLKHFWYFEYFFQWVCTERWETSYVSFISLFNLKNKQLFDIDKFSL